MNRVDFNIAKKFIKHPAKIAIISSKCEKKINLITVERLMRTSINPPMFAVSIGHNRYTHNCMEQNRYFNICFPSKEMQYIALLTGTKSGKDINKLSQISPQEYFMGRFRRLPIFKNAVANFECETISQITSGDHTIYIGKVKYSWLNEEKELLLYKDIESGGKK